MVLIRERNGMTTSRRLLKTSIETHTRTKGIQLLISKISLH